jgi:hypothetical protein
MARYLHIYMTISISGNNLHLSKNLHILPWRRQFYPLVICSNRYLVVGSFQPQTIRINQPDQAAGAAQSTQRSACCGS